MKCYILWCYQQWISKSHLCKIWNKLKLDRSFSNFLIRELVIMLFHLSTNIYDVSRNNKEKRNYICKRQSAINHVLNNFPFYWLWLYVKHKDCGYQFYNEALCRTYDGLYEPKLFIKCKTNHMKKKVVFFMICWNHSWIENNILLLFNY